MQSVSQSRSVCLTEQDARAEASESGIIWLASYPKSGNTWVRLFLAALVRVPDLATMVGTPRGASARALLQRVLDISLDMLSPLEVESLRSLAYRHLAARNTGVPLVLKAHDCFRDTPAGGRLFPLEATAGCLHLVRDPRDLCLSLAAHSAVTVDRAIAIMGEASYTPFVGLGNNVQQVTEIWGSWSEHARSWLDAPIHRLTLRYEDLLAEPLASFAEIARFCGLEVSAQTLAESVRQTSFDQLVAQEADGSFLERPAAMPKFFRAGRAGQWRDALSVAQVARIERDHGAVMAHLGYLD